MKFTKPEADRTELYVISIHGGPSSLMAVWNGNQRFDAEATRIPTVARSWLSRHNERGNIMRAYKAETIEGFEATIFATSNDEAATIFCVHHDAYMDRMPPNFTVGMVKRPRPGMQRRHLEDALDRNIDGVGYYMQGRGWTIIPAERLMKFTEVLPELPGDASD